MCWSMKIEQQRVVQMRNIGRGASVALAAYQYRSQACASAHIESIIERSAGVVLCP